MTAVDTIEISGVSKRYGRHRALASVDLSLSTGLCALLGPNGAGKSTMLGIISTLVRPSAGKVVYRRTDGSEAAGAALRQHIGVLAHEPMVYGQLSAEENLRFWAELYQVPDTERRASDLLDRVGLDGKARQRPASTYSRGMLQRLALARALLHEPSVLLLDEPFSGLDRKGTAALQETLSVARGDGRLLLVVTHDLEAIAEHTDHLVVLRRGKLAHEDRRAAGEFDYRELQDIYHRYSD
ncbi:MAG: ABC transporter ATP-binding protein [Deltaproteobacteria bacterium]|nr:ABC transporter ATP-binding protein [Deltaproteobacteria bacterium]